MPVKREEQHTRKALDKLLTLMKAKVFLEKEVSSAHHACGAAGLLIKKVAYFGLCKQRGAMHAWCAFGE